MCVAIPGRVISVDGDGALVEIRARRRRVLTVLLPDVRPGEMVLISNGMIVERLSEDEASERDAIFGAMLEAIDETT
ncbi:MAG TPA: HypC/HybG/HupF family hydrogenase formation chaperone [Dehalococcoidia bacterium]|jgi:hydrogenase assembly chaperone HypC/HupF|nr:HypC/HybG/HupF family hydrogenase formation chaperone [Dehalococcoidia bacterium]